MDPYQGIPTLLLNPLGLRRLRNVLPRTFKMLSSGLQIIANHLLHELFVVIPIHDIQTLLKSTFQMVPFNIRNQQLEI